MGGYSQRLNQKISFIGARSLYPGEKQLIKKKGLKFTLCMKLIN